MGTGEEREQLGFTPAPHHHGGPPKQPYPRSQLGRWHCPQARGLTQAEEVRGSRRWGPWEISDHELTGSHSVLGRGGSIPPGTQCS